MELIVYQVFGNRLKLLIKNVQVNKTLPGITFHVSVAYRNENIFRLLMKYKCTKLNNTEVKLPLFRKI